MHSLIWIFKTNPTWMNVLLGAIAVLTMLGFCVYLVQTTSSTYQSSQITGTNSEIIRNTEPRSLPASSADKAVRRYCSHIIYDLGDVTEDMVQAVYVSDPDTLTRYPEISTDVITFVRQFVNNDLPATPENTLKLRSLCRTWGDAEFERVFGEKPHR